mmetsp:Transcript_8831/g.12169  ORF Transcript_8831/g.12169 Transcript_8831/m.12169 type:complete len:309 (-) Transcript_8831:36-962(-)
MEFTFGFAQVNAKPKTMSNNKSSSLKAAQVKDIFVGGNSSESGFLPAYGTAANNESNESKSAKNVIDSFVVIDDYLSNQPKQLTKSAVTDASNAGNKNTKDTTQHPPRIEEKYIVHTLANKETAQGLAVRYHVSISDVKKLNKLWSEGEIFGKKEILIPKTEASVAQAQAILERLANPSSNNNNSSSFSPKDMLTANNQPSKEVLQTFMEVTQTDELIAQHFLQERNWNYTKALELFYAQKERTEKYNRERNTDDKYDHLTQKQSLRDELKLKSGPAAPSEAVVPHWTNIRKSMQDKMVQQAEELFDL